MGNIFMIIITTVVVAVILVFITFFIVKKNISKKYKNIIVVDRENKGISVTRNEGIKLASGEYIAFVDSDDYVELDMYEKLYKKITEDKSDIVVCNYKMFNDNLEFTSIDISSKGKNTNVYDKHKMVYEMEYAPWNK